MSEFESGAAVAESPTAPATQADPSAGTQNTGTNGQPADANVPFHLHPRWQERTQEIQTLRAQNAQLNARLQQLEQRREQTGAPVSEEEQQLRAAREALYSKLAPELNGLPQMVQRMVQRDFVNTGEQIIKSFAEQHGLNASELSNDIAAAIQQDKMLMQRAQQGDISIIPLLLRSGGLAAKGLKSQAAEAQRQAAATVGQTKTAQAKLPPRVTGGVPGGVAFTKPVAGDAASIRTAKRERHDAMSRMVDEL